MFVRAAGIVTTAVLVAAAAPGGAAAQAQVEPTPPDECTHHGVPGQPYRIGVNCRVVEVDGYPRKFIVYVPDRAPVTGSSAPVVFMFHGTSGTGDQFLRISGWREQADANGLVAVFPQGLPYRVIDSNRKVTKWNSFDLPPLVTDELPAGYPDDSPWPADDVGFVDAIMDDLLVGLPIDRHRVYASGFSNGAAFAARLGVERSTRVAAVAFSAEGLHAVPVPAPERATPMYLTLGTLDDRALSHTGPPPLTELPLSPFAALAEPFIGRVAGVHVDTLGLDERDFGVHSLPNSTSFRWPAAGTGPGGAVFRFALLGGLGHHYPNGGQISAGFEAAPEFWQFFREHPLP